MLEAEDRAGDRLPPRRLTERSPAPRGASRSSSAAPRWRAASGSRSMSSRPQQAQELWPLMTIDDLVGGVYLPKDGQHEPDRHHAGARQGRARPRRAIVETRQGHRVSSKEGGALPACAPSAATSSAEYVVNCAGMWARELGRLCRRQRARCTRRSISTSSPSRLPRCRATLPVLRDPDNADLFQGGCRQAPGRLVRAGGQAWGMAAFPKRSRFDQLPADLEHIEPLLERAIKRVPIASGAGIRLFFNGPESFTPDDRYLLGERPSVRNLFVAAGFNSIGIQSAGGAGKVLAEWIATVTRRWTCGTSTCAACMPFQRNRALSASDRTVEALGLLYAMHWPFRQPETARGVRRSALHDRLAGRAPASARSPAGSAPNWFAPAGRRAVLRYTATGARTGSSTPPPSTAPCARRSGCSTRPLSPSSAVEGPDAEAVLKRICANDIAVAGRQDRLHAMAERARRHRGRPHRHARLAETAFLIVTAAATPDARPRLAEAATSARASASPPTSPPAMR